MFNSLRTQSIETELGMLSELEGEHGFTWLTLGKAAPPGDECMFLLSGTNCCSLVSTDSRPECDEK